MTLQLLDQSAIAQKFKFTTQQYHLMHEAGVFNDGDRLELINGEIKIMSPIGRKHATCVARLTDLFVNRLFRKAIIWPQNSIRLKDNSEPQPDLAILKFRDDFYEGGLPTPEDILLIIEVADSSIDYDRDVKAPLYAAAGIPEMWLFDVNKKVIEGYSQPSPLGYKQIHRYDEGDMLSMLAFSDVIFNWNELF
ncbi:Uma2 family endonuclease [Pseudanabaena biceps]|nr:Uma2 family endonuclease [Pseudanabaena biceps]